MPQPMLLPSKNAEESLLVTLPEDIEPHAAFRCAVSVIAEAEDENPNVSRQELTLALEDHGFQVIDFIVGPSIK